MEIAAHTPGGYGGVPQSVGKEFVSADLHEGEKKDATSDLNDYETMEAVRDGKLPSPTKFGDYWIFALRITGTGAAWREALGEYAHRDEKLWTSPAFLQRCNGLTVIGDHPPKGGLNSEEFEKRAIGSIMLPYVKETESEPEVWGVAKIFDADWAEKMQTTHTSTSPGVTAPKGSVPIVLEGGDKVLDEGLPFDLNHLAVCEAGVWDKDGPPEGVRLDSQLIGKGEVVDEEERKKLEKERDDAKMRADAMEKELEDRKRKDSERHDAERRDMRRDREDARRKDAGEEKESEEEERKREDRHMADRKKRHDAEKHDAEMMDCAKCDAAEDEEAERAEKEREDRRKDAAAAKVAEVNAEFANELRDSKARADQLQAKIDALERNQQPLDHNDANEIAAAQQRADSIFGMFGEKAPVHMAGERPRAYRNRLLNTIKNLLPEGSQYKSVVFNDSIIDPGFRLMEDALYAEVYAEAKNPTRNDATRHRLIPRVTKDELGRTKTEYHGSSRAGLGSFVSGATFVGKIVRPQAGS